MNWKVIRRPQNEEASMKAPRILFPFACAVVGLYPEPYFWCKHLAEDERETPSGVKGRMTNYQCGYTLPGRSRRFCLGLPIPRPETDRPEEVGVDLVP